MFCSSARFHLIKYHEDHPVSSHGALPHFSQLPLMYYFMCIILCKWSLINSMLLLDFGVVVFFLLQTILQQTFFHISLGVWVNISICLRNGFPL